MANGDPSLRFSSPPLEVLGEIGRSLSNFFDIEQAWMAKPENEARMQRAACNKTWYT